MSTDLRRAQAAPRRDHVLVVDGADAARGRLIHSLAGAGFSAESLASLPRTAAELPACGALVVDYKTVGTAPSLRASALGALVRELGVPLVLLVDGRWPQDHPEIIECAGVHHVVAKTADIDDLVCVLRALASGTPPTLERWLGKPQHEEALVVTGSRDKESALAATRAFAQGLGINERLVANACVVVEELVTNAVYNAPLGADGAHAHATWKRTEPVALADDKRVDVVLRADGRRLAISVVDRWGTLKPERMLTYIAKGLRRGADQVDRKEGGAGLGLYQVFDAASHVVAVLDAGVRTEVTALIEAGGTYRAFALESKSLNVFAR